MSFRSALKSVFTTVVEFHTEMMTPCVVCEVPTVKSRHSNATICDSCSSQDNFAVLLTTIFTGAHRPRPLITAIGEFADKKIAEKK